MIAPSEVKVAAVSYCDVCQLSMTFTESGLQWRWEEMHQHGGID